MVHLCCIPTIIIISVTTVIQHINKCIRIQILRLFRYERLLTSGLLDTRRERQFLKVFRIILCQRNSQLPGRTLTSQHHGRNSTSQPSASTADNPTFCLHGPKSTFQLPLFQNLQILGTIASEHDIIHTPAPL